MMLSGSVPSGTRTLVRTEVDVFFGTVSVAGSTVTASPSKSKSAVATTGDKMLLADVSMRSLLLLSRRTLSRRSDVRFGFTPALRPPVWGICRALTPIANTMNDSKATVVQVRSETLVRSDLIGRRGDTPVSFSFIEFEDSRSENGPSSRRG